MNSVEIDYLDKKLKSGATIMWNRRWTNGSDYVRIKEVYRDGSGHPYATFHIGWPNSAVDLEAVGLSEFHTMEKLQLPEEPRTQANQDTCDHHWWTVVSCSSYFTRQCYKCTKRETIDKD